MQKSIHTAAYATFLELLIEVRTRAGVTQKQLGMDLPYEQPSISKMERGERRIDLIEMRMICQRLGISLGEFVKELEARLDERNA